MSSSYLVSIFSNAPIESKWGIFVQMNLIGQFYKVEMFHDIISETMQINNW